MLNSFLAAENIFFRLCRSKALHFTAFFSFLLVNCSHLTRGPKESLKLISEFEAGSIFVETEENIDASMADERFREKADYMSALFSAHFDPYWGTIDDKSKDCLKDQIIQPQIQMANKQKSLLFKLKATDEHSVGSCQPGVNTKWARIQYLYCEESKVFFTLKQFEKVTETIGSPPLGECSKF